MSTVEWRDRIMASHQTDVTTTPVECKVSIPDLSNTTQKQNPVSSLSTASMSKSQEKAARSKRDSLVNKELEKTEKLSYISEYPDWETNLNLSYRKYQYNPQKWVTASDFMTMGNKNVHFIPSRDVIVSSCSESNIESVLDDIESCCSPHNGLAVVQKCWRSLLPEPHNTPSPPEHIMDMLLFTSKPDVYFWVVAGKVEEARKERQMGYLFGTSRLLKSCLVDQMDRKYPVSIRCQLKQIGQDPIEGEYQQMISDVFPNPDSDTLRTALASVLLKKDTWLKHELIAEKNIQLTSDQLETILKLGVPCQFNVIEGPPGSGKSLLAKALNDKHPDDTAWIVPRPAFKRFLISRGVNTVYAVLTDADLKTIVSCHYLDNYKFIIIDDAHHFNLTQKSWQKFFAFVHEQSARLFVFQDNKIQNYKATNSPGPGIKSMLKSFRLKLKGESTSCDIALQLNIFCTKRPELLRTLTPLTEMLRNDRKIASYIITNAGNLGATISCANENTGHDVEIIKMENIWNQSEENDLVKFIKETISPKDSLTSSPIAYSSKDIAVLIDCPNTENAVQRLMDILKQFIDAKHAKVHDACTQPPEGVTVDSVQNFMGLDAKLCVYITSDPDARTNLGQLTDPKYKAFLASRAVSRAVFVVPQFTCDLVRTLQFGELERFYQGPPPPPAVPAVPAVRRTPRDTDRDYPTEESPYQTLEEAGLIHHFLEHDMPGWSSFIQEKKESEGLQHIAVWSITSDRWVKTYGFPIEAKDVMELENLLRQGLQYKQNKVKIFGKTFELDREELSETHVHLTRYDKKGTPMAAWVSAILDYVVIAVSNQNRDTQCVSIVYDIHRHLQKFLEGLI